jgi:hypothetical protein
MPKIVNRLTGNIVRIGDKLTLPGNMPVEVAAFETHHITFRALEADARWVVPLCSLGLEWRESVVTQPWSLMTDDDWIHATNHAKDRGGHFASNLARAYQHSDGSNRKPIRQAERFQQLFFDYLDHERREALTLQAKELQ